MKNARPICCGSAMEYEGSDGDWENVTDHYVCKSCGSTKEQLDHVVVESVVVSNRMSA